MKVWRFALLAALTIACGRAPLAAQMPPLRLPSGVTPLEYQLDLTVFPDRSSFDGRVRIDIRFDAPTDAFWMHGRDLEVDKATLRAGADAIPATYRQRSSDGSVRIELAKAVGTGTAQLDISYHGRINTTISGLFHVQAGSDWYAFTQFESIDARAVFPCFDEPLFKTPFTLSVVAPHGDAVAANTPAAEIIELPDGTKRVRFEPTAKLPTYLVAFAVGPFDVVDGPPVVADSRRVPVRGIAAKGRGPAFARALADTPALVARLTDYFAMPYPFAKLDLVAVPGQEDAMENAALITYAEYLMLLGEQPPLRQQRVFAAVHAHELAHQWFGDSVTMRWWDDLWLNEAFAEFLSYKIVQDWQPTYRAQQGLVEASLGAMSEDRLATARRIREPIGSSDDITNAFDGITYAKGAGVLNMLDAYLGESAFRDGIRLYLQQHAGGSADVGDLVAALSHVAPGADVDGIVRTFTEQPGTPQIDVALDCSAKQPMLDLKQRRYLPVGSSADASRIWHVPVCVRFDADGQARDRCFLLTQPSARVALDGAARCPAWLMPNRGGRGYYRWHMSDRQLRDLDAALFTALDTGEQLSFADALSAGVAAGDVGLAAFFDHIPRLLESTDRYVLMMPLPLWRTVQTHMLTETGKAASRAKIRSLYGPVLQSLRTRGIEEEEDELMQSDLVRVLAVDARDVDMRRELSHLAQQLVGFGSDGRMHRDALDVNAWNTALLVAVQDLGAGFGDHVAALLGETDDPVLRHAMLMAIGGANDTALPQRIALGGIVKGDELVELVPSMFDAEHATQNWPWLAANIDALIEATTPFARRVLITMTAGLCSRKDADAVAVLFEPRLGRIDGGRRALDQTLERIQLCTALTDTYRERAQELFK